MRGNKNMKDDKDIKVMAIYTLPKMWKAIVKTHKALQGNNPNSNADYIAFIRLHLEDDFGDPLPGGAITHIAKVEKINYGKSVCELLKKFPEFAEIHEDKEWSGYCNEYLLGEIEQLSKPIYHKKGDSARSQVKFFTTMTELKKANFLSDMKTLSQLENMK